MSKFQIFIMSILIIYSFHSDLCLESSNNICISCEMGYYLDISSNNKCKDSYLVPIFHNCQETEDGI